VIPARAARRLLWEPPGESLLPTGSAGELTIARARVVLSALLLAVAGLVYGRDPGAAQTRIHLVGGMLALPLTVLIYLLVRRVHYRWWMGIGTSLLDVTMVSAALGVFLVAGNPYHAVNSQIVFPLYFLALAATTMRLDHRACSLAGFLGVLQYVTIVLIAALGWELNVPEHAPFTHGMFDASSQAGRVLLLGAMGALGTLVNLRMQKPHILSAADTLTGLQNRRTFEERWHGEAARARRYGRPISIAAVDIDYFKQFNDTYGHAAGDAALRSVGRVIRSRVRAGDFAARIGGEEFAIALPETNSTNAMTMAEQIRQSIADTQVRIAGHRRPVNVTVSIGVASWPEHGEEISRLLERADNRLYEAKLAGRDQVKGPGVVAPSRPQLVRTSGGRVRPL
jgi:diguanylate cyclase (GGDEF)-like protein